jgi:SlyX protein
MEERIVELETRLAFQEDTIQHLNQTVSDQQRQIDALKETVETLKQRLRSISPSPVGSEGPEPPPPHY